MSCSREVTFRKLMAAERPSVETQGTHRYCKLLEEL
jgi:hypothetical protein